MINKLKQEKGITLVALVITVVVMTILITITIDKSVDQDLIDTTQNVAKDYNHAIVYQTLNTIFISERGLYDDGFITEDTMWLNIERSINENEELEEYGIVEVTPEKDGDVTVELTVKVGTMQYRITMDKVEEI